MNEKYNQKVLKQLLDAEIVSDVWVPINVPD